MPGQHSAAISYKMMKTFGDTKVIGPLLIGLGLPIEIAPLRSSTSELINLASIGLFCRRNRLQKIINLFELLNLQQVKY